MKGDLATLKFGLGLLEQLIAIRKLGLALAYCRDLRRLERRLTRLRQGYGGQARRLRSL